MMSKRNTNLKGRKIKDKFLPLFYSLLHHRDFKSLSSRATKLLIDIGAPYNGYNNGDLAATMSLMKERGWNSNDQLQKAKNELLAKNLIIITRQGGRKRPTLYALTWLPIDDCNGKLDIESTTKAPRNFSLE